LKRFAGDPWIIFLAWVAVCSLVFFTPLRALVAYALANDSASHILIIPFIVASLLYLDRLKLPRYPLLDLPAAVPFALVAALTAAISLWKFPAHLQAGLSLLTFSWILSLIAGFVGIFGRRPATSVWFSLAFLGFAIPVPPKLLDGSIYVLQSGSAAIAGWIFDLFGVANWREGFVFHLAGWDIEVARECSGIRSSMAILIVAVLVAHFSLAKFWKKVVFVAAALLIMVVKNGVRIATLSMLAKYIDPSFLFGRLHHEGGVVLFLFGLALLLPIYWLLRRGDPPNVCTKHQHEAIV
jgi:exosortase